MAPLGFMVLFVLVSVGLLYCAGCLLMRVLAAVAYVASIPRRINKMLFRLYAGIPIIP